MTCCETRTFGIVARAKRISGGGEKRTALFVEMSCSMTFPEAILALPRCSYAVNSTTTLGASILGDSILVVWFLYHKTPSTRVLSDADTGAAVRMEAFYIEDGAVSQGPSEQMHERKSGARTSFGSFASAAIGPPSFLAFSNSSLIAFS